jgi:hypothetical protein
MVCKILVFIFLITYSLLREFFCSLFMLLATERTNVPRTATEIANIIEVPSDLERDQIVNIFAQVYPNYPLDAEGIRDFISSPNVKTVCVKNEQGEIVGVGFLEIESQSNGYGSVTGVAVLPNQRKKGLGVLINDRLIQLAQSEGLKFLQSDPVLNFEGPTDGAGQTRQGGGNNPNLANLKITLTKFNFLSTGFSLGGFRDISGELGRDGEQDTSVIRSVRAIDLSEIRDFNEQYIIATAKLEAYWDSTPSIPADYTQGNLQDENILNGNNNRIKIATSTKIEDFQGASFLPTYFLPCYTKENETVYVGVYYEQGIRTRTSRGQEDENIFDLDKAAISITLSDPNKSKLLTQIITGITLNYENRIQYSDPSIKAKNL